MRVIHVNAYDIRGGAARAARNLVLGQRREGMDARMLVQRRESREHDFVIGPATAMERWRARLRPHIAQLPLLLYPRRRNNGISSQWLADRTDAAVERLRADIVHLHWICAGFIQIETLARWRRPLVWTLHDTWAFTGGCHYAEAWECDRWLTGCGRCPLLGSARARDLSARVWQRKAAVYPALTLHVVSPSNWLADLARRSPLLRGHAVSVIPNGIDLQVFRQQDRGQARARLGLPADKRVILFAAAKAGEKSKGLHLLVRALALLADRGSCPDLELAVLGHAPDMPETPLPLRRLGFLADPGQVAAAYCAADVFVAPSMHDNLPNTVLEALACATPVVAFAVGGMPDMIDHARSGYLARAFEPADLARGLEFVLADPARRHNLGRAARAAAEQRFSLQRQARTYARLYEDLLTRR